MEAVTASMSPEEPKPEPDARERLFALHRELTKDALALMKRKSQDYSNGENPYRNFEMFGGLGILVRISDKLARMRSFEERGTFEVLDESLRDSVIDLLNYSIIYLAYKKEGKR